MTPARLQTIEEIYRAALDQKPDQISAFLDRACGGDEVLRRKVEALLASRERAADFIETSAVGLATKVIQNGQADLLVGQTIGHYKISEPIGTGGMGEVYLATDVTAGRKAALKLLPLRFTGDAERLKRFQQEARAVVGLNHPNILTVYEIGEDHSIHYIASELIEGETLREHLTHRPMQLGEAVDIAIQVISALVAAHEAGIVHRDIKPENIMLRPDGYVKVLDFGIAKLAEQEVSVTTPRDEALLLVETNLGSILGTVRYMSPEQACGAPVDKRTDIWSLGVVLYEMVTGHAPFTGDTPREVMSSILEKEPPPLTHYIAHAPAELQQIISKTLRKKREERYQSAHALLQALKDLRRKLEAELERAAAPLWLRWARSPAAVVLGLLLAAFAVTLPFYWHRNLPTISPSEKSIAVLPFENLSPDAANAYFADGIREEILTRLAGISDLKVISRTSTQRYQTKPANLSEIAKQLGVANILEGSVQKATDQVRVNVQLINTQTDSHLWADTYDRKLTDIFDVESEIAKRIAESLQAKLTGREQQVLALKSTNNPEAYDAYLRGIAYSERPEATEADILEAIHSLRKAVTLDPASALAWARLAHASGLGCFNQYGEDFRAACEQAKRAADKAVSLQPDLAESKLAQGYWHYYGERDYDAAIPWFEKAHQLSPNNSLALKALALVYRRKGDWQHSLEYFARAIELDPRNIELLADHGETLAAVRRYPEALKAYDKILDMVPSAPLALADKIGIYQSEGDLPSAAAVLAQLHPVPPSALFEAQMNQLVYEHRYTDAIAALMNALGSPGAVEDIWVTIGIDTRIAWLEELLGDINAARTRYEKVRSQGEEFRKRRHFFLYDVCLAFAHRALGDKDKAFVIMREIAVSQSAEPTNTARIDRQICALTMRSGDKASALKQLSNLASRPYGDVTYGDLKFNPLWDPLRGDPRFEKLVEEVRKPVELR